MALFNWYPGFNPRGPKPTKVPVWVEFPDLPMDYYPWLKQIGSCLGIGLGQRARGGFNPKWDPQMLIEIDLSKDLKTEVPIRGHHIKDYPDSKPAASSVETDPNKNEEFQPVPKRNTARGGKNAKQGKNRSILSPSLENVFEPFSINKKDTNEQFYEAPLEATDDPQKEDKDLFEDADFDMDNPNLDLDAGELGSPSSSSDEESIPNSQYSHTHQVNSFAEIGDQVTTHAIVRVKQSLDHQVHFDLGMGNADETSDKAPATQLLYLKYQFENEVGEKIYKDGMEQFCVEIEERPSESRNIVRVVYSRDYYFNDQGFMYLVVQNPSIIDKWRMTGTKENIDVEPEEALPALNKPDLKLRRINNLTRVNTDNTFLGLYKYDNGNHVIYYRCEEPLVDELLDQKRLYVFYYMKKKFNLIMVDKYSRTYVNIDEKELEGYKYYGGPLPNYYFTPPRLEPTVKPTESMGYPVYPDVRSMGSLGSQVSLTTHLGSETYFADSHAREPMSYEERGVDARSSRRVSIETHSRGMDKRKDMSDRMRMWANTRRMRPSQVAKCMPKSIADLEIHMLTYHSSSKS
ncbi:hypothetical protein L7F22_010717 [Adiantum nelumboides]|nr:hypothetical protein [Adiantum nelumboides]